MTFVPALPLSGYAGWKFLERTREAQQAALSASSAMKTNETYFRENIGKVRSAEELVADRRLLSVALGAFGLDDDVNNKFFIRKVLEGSTSDPQALANKLSDKRYLDMANAFGFGDFPAARLRTNAEAELPKIAATVSTVDAKWNAILKNDPLREVVVTALAPPEGFDRAGPARQLQMLKDRAEALFQSSDPAVFGEASRVRELTRQFTVQNGFQALAADGERAARTLPNTVFPSFADEILSSFKTRQFERAVGESDQSMRLAMNAQRELAALAEKPSTENTKWFRIMGNAPLRQVFEVALGLPKQFGSADLDRQLDVFKERAETFLGSSDPAMFADPKKVEDLVRLYLIRAEASSGISPTAPGAVALSLLQSGPVGGFF